MCLSIANSVHDYALLACSCQGVPYPGMLSALLLHFPSVHVDDDDDDDYHGDDHDGQANDQDDDDVDMIKKKVTIIITDKVIHHDDLKGSSLLTWSSITMT